MTSKLLSAILLHTANVSAKGGFAIGNNFGELDDPRKEVPFLLRLPEQKGRIVNWPASNLHLDRNVFVIDYQFGLIYLTWSIYLSKHNQTVGISNHCRRVTPKRR